jgi:hypothetical protein
MWIYYLEMTALIAALLVVTFPNRRKTYDFGVVDASLAAARECST